MRDVLRPAFGALAALALVLGGCGNRPDTRAQRALYNDLDYAVTARERLGWYVDRVELEAALGSAMRSACQVEPEARLGLLAWLDTQIEQDGGSAERLYTRDGLPLSDVTALLHRERMRALLAKAHAHAEDDCPFWLEPTADFIGVEGSAHRFVLLLETQGGLEFVFNDGGPTLGGGGGGRIIPAYGITDRVTVGLGGGLGGGSQLPKSDGGDRQFTAYVEGGIPLLVRYREGLILWDSVAEIFARAPEDDLERFDPGARLSQSIGFASLRIGPFMPYGLISIDYEIFPAARGRETLHGVRFGTRVGLVWDP